MPENTAAKLALAATPAANTFQRCGEATWSAVTGDEDGTAGRVFMMAGTGGDALQCAVHGHGLNVIIPALQAI